MLPFLEQELCPVHGTLHHASRRLASPAAQWTARQVVEAFPRNGAPGPRAYGQDAVSRSVPKESVPDVPTPSAQVLRALTR